MRIWIKHILSLFLLFACTSICGQITVSGTVTDPTGEKLIGSDITVKGSAQFKTTTNIDGYYIFEVPDTAKTLVFSYVGFTDVEKDLGFMKTRFKDPGSHYTVDLILSEIGCNRLLNNFAIGPSKDFSNKTFGLKTDLYLHNAFGFNPRIQFKLNTNSSQKQTLVDFNFNKHTIIHEGYYHGGLGYKYRSFSIPDKDFDRRHHIFGIQSSYWDSNFFVGYATEQFQKSENRYDRGTQHGVNIEFHHYLRIRRTYLFDLVADFTKFNKKEHYKIQAIRNFHKANIGLIWRDVELYKSVELFIQYNFNF